MNVLPGSLSAWADLGQPGRSGVWKGMINDPSLCGVACHTHALGELVFRNACEMVLILPAPLISAWRGAR
jgi:hypothetical protein